MAPPPSSTRRSQQKRQTRLTFEPLDAADATQSSSPTQTAASGRSAAKVRYQTANGRIGKQRATMSSPTIKIDENVDGEVSLTQTRSASKFLTSRHGKTAANQPFLTPQSSSLVAGGSSSRKRKASDRIQSSSESEGLSPQPKRARKGVSSPGQLQTRLRDGGGARTGDSSFINRHKRTMGPPSKKTRRDEESPVVIDSSSESGDTSGVDEGAQQDTLDRFTGVNSKDEDTSKSARETATRTHQKRRNKSTSSPKRTINQVEIESDLSEDTTPRTNRRSRATLIVESDDEGSDELPSIQDLGKQKATMTLNRRVAATIQSSSEESDMVISSPRKRRRNIPSAVDDESDEDKSEDGDSDSDAFQASSSRSGKARVIDVSSDDSSSLEITPSTRRTRNGRLKQKPGSEEDNASQPGLPPTSSSRKRQTKRPRRTAKQKQMELLRRKRAGEDIDELTPSEDDESELEPKSALYDSDSELEVLKEFDDETDGEEVEVVPDIKLRKGKSKLEDDDSEDEDDGFVVEDDDEPLGAPSIPLEFTHHAHKPLKAHFKDAIEWMVHNRINPAFARDDAIYKVAFRKLNDEVTGYANSKFASSAWKLEFRRALYARPTFSEIELGSAEASMLDRKCEACGRSGHPAKWRVQFEGHAYHRDTLEDMEPPEDSEGEQDDDADSVNSNGEVIPEATISWYVGRFCKANAETAHSLIHWKWALNSWVLDELKSEGWDEPEKVVDREKMNRKNRTALANGIVDEWEADGKIKALWRDFKLNLESARSDKNRFDGKNRLVLD